MSMVHNHSEATIDKYMAALKELKLHIDKNPRFGITTWCKDKHLNSATVKALRDTNIIESSYTTKSYVGSGRKAEYFWIGGEVDVRLINLVLGRISEIKREYKLSADKKKKYAAKLEDKRKENSYKILEAKIAKRREFEELNKLPLPLQEMEDESMVIHDHLAFLRVLHGLIIKHGGIYSNNTLLKEAARRYNIDGTYIEVLANMSVIYIILDNGIALIDWNGQDYPEFDLAVKFKTELEKYVKNINEPITVPPVKDDAKEETKSLYEAPVLNETIIEKPIVEKFNEINEETKVQDSKRPLIIELAKEFAKIEDYEFALILMRKLQ
jgi:glutaredoxin